MSAAARRLRMVEALIGTLYRRVGVATPAQLAHLRTTAPGQVVLIDVRAAAEYAVSHIANARRVDPALPTTAMLAAAGDIRGRTVVCYCAVGLRSARFVARHAHVLGQAGAKAVHHLSGGVFRWHNEFRPLVDAYGPTDRLHPVSTPWHRLIARRHLVATTPRAHRPDASVYQPPLRTGDLTRSPPSD